MKKKNGITLIALVVTIIVLLILAGVTISLVVGPDGVVQKTQETKIAGRYGAIMDKIYERDASLEIAFRLNEEGEHQEDFINRLIREDLLKEGEYNKTTYRTIFLGLQNDGTYKYTIDVKDGTSKGVEIANLMKTLPNANASGNSHLKNMTLMVETSEYNLSVGLNISNPLGLEINWDASNQPENFIPYTDPFYTYPSEGEYEIQIRGVAQPGTEFGFYENWDNDLVTFGDYNIVGVKYWGENGFSKINGFAHQLKYEIPLPSINSFENVTEFTTTFANNNNLTEIPPALFINAPLVESFFRTFGRCRNIASIPENLFINCPNVTNFTRTFMVCSSLTEIPENLFKYNPIVSNFAGVFSGCTNITNIPNKLFANNPEFEITTGYFDDGHRGLFSYCENLITIPEDLFANNPKIENFSFAFRDCANLQSIPENLFANNPLAKRFERIFFNCREVTGNAPRIWEIPGATGSFAFNGCSDLDNFYEIPHHWHAI